MSTINHGTDLTHYRPRFVIFNYLLGKAIDEDCNFLDLDLAAFSPTITVRLYRTWIYMTGIYAFYALALDVHTWICMGAVNDLRETYDSLSAVFGYTERLSQIVRGWPNPQWMFVRPNTSLTEVGDVELRTYEVSNDGIIQSRAERNV